MAPQPQNYPNPQAAQAQGGMNPEALADPIQASDEMFSPKKTAGNVTSGFFKGLFRGALALGVLAAAVTAGLSGFGLFGLEAAGEAAVAGHPGGGPIAGAAGATFSLSNIALSTVGYAAAWAAAIGGLFFGTREASMRAGAAAGYQHGRQVGRLETMAVTEAMVQEIAQGMEQEQARGQSHQRQPQRGQQRQHGAHAHPAKQPVSFEHMPNHPAHQPKTERVALGKHTGSVMAQSAQEQAAALGGPQKV